MKKVQPIKVGFFIKKNGITAALHLVRPEGFEPPTFGSVDQRSIQLSYERISSSVVIIAQHNYFCNSF